MSTFLYPSVLILHNLVFKQKLGLIVFLGCGRVGGFQCPDLSGCLHCSIINLKSQNSGKNLIKWPSITAWHSKFSDLAMAMSKGILYVALCDNEGKQKIYFQFKVTEK